MSARLATIGFGEGMEITKNHGVFSTTYENKISLCTKVFKVAGYFCKCTAAKIANTDLEQQHPCVAR